MKGNQEEAGEGRRRQKEDKGDMDEMMGVVSDRKGGEPEERDEGDEPDEAADPVLRRACPVPSPEERRVHRLTHLPFRSWCPQCVAGAANDDPHRAKKIATPAPLAVPVVHWDYCFPRDATDWSVVLVGRDQETRMTRKTKRKKCRSQAP